MNARSLELDRAGYPEFRDSIVAADTEGGDHEPRTYPGYPRVALERVGPRRLASLDRALAGRRSRRDLGTRPVSRRDLSRILLYSHGVHATLGRGPTPSAGGLQALELYAVWLAGGWLAPGAYHYDRAGHHLSRVVEGASRERWAELLPSSVQYEGGALVWIVAGDGARVERKYGDRGLRFLLLEAGHLMQSLCLVTASLGLSTLPLGGCFEREVSRELLLPPADLVLYAAACGAPQDGSAAGRVML